MRSRLVVSSMAVTLLFGGVTAATAKPLPCKLLTDPAHDDDIAPTVDHPMSSGSLDLTSTDMATNARDLTVVMRVRSLLWPDPDSPNGWYFSIDVTIGSTFLTFAASKDPLGEKFRAYRRNAQGGGNGAAELLFVAKSTGVFDEDSSEVRITTPLADLRKYAPMRAGDRVTNVRVYAAQLVGENSQPIVAMRAGSVDSIDGGRASYRVGDRNCVIVGY